MGWVAAAIVATFAAGAYRANQETGVQFDADPGMCEPVDRWQWRLADGGDLHNLQRRLSVAWVPDSETCVSRLAGVPPGGYRVTVTPSNVALPEYTMAFTVRRGRWTVVRVPEPFVVVFGRITAHGRPVAGARVNFSLLSDGRERAASAPPRLPFVRFAEPAIGYTVGQVMTDAEGRYRTTIGPGRYRRSVIPFSVPGGGPSIDADVTIVAGRNEQDVDVGGGALRIAFSERGGTVSKGLRIGVTVQALPDRALVFRVDDPFAPIDIDTLLPGKYVISAHAEGADENGKPKWLVASRVHEIAVSATTRQDVSIDLVTQDALLDVVTPEGQPIEGASVIPVPLLTGVQTDASGRISLSTLPVGKHLPIRTRTWGMSCHVVTHDAVQRAVVHDAPSQVTFVWLADPPGTTTLVNSAEPAKGPLSGGVVAGIPSATCPVPWEAFLVARRRLPDSWELSINLPAGAYTMTLLDGRVLTFTAPGRVEIKDIK